MDDMTLLALGRSYVENSLIRENLIRRNMELQAKLDEATKVTATATAEIPPA